MKTTRLMGKTEPPLEIDARRRLAEVVSEIRGLLLSEAAVNAGDAPISAIDIESGRDSVLSGFGRSFRGKVNAQMHISAAKSENKRYERIASVMAIVLFVLGVGFLCAGALQDTPLACAAMVTSGTVLELSFLVPLRIITNTRRHNIAIRMLGVVLDQVQDEETFNTVLKESFLSIVGEMHPNPSDPRGK